MQKNNLPRISIVIPTLNAESVLKDCLESIAFQDYPKNKVEIIIADGGSTDGTLDLVQKYSAKVVQNKLKTGESGKAVGVMAAAGDYIALIDSDNILPTKNWLREMIIPLESNKKAVGSEPWRYTWRKEDGFITRYCALIGMNDPFVHFLGNYDRQNLLTGTWTEVSHDEKDKGDYLLCTFDKRGLPTIGANGTVFRTDFLKSRLKGDYLFDIDILAAEIKEKGSVNFIKVKNGIIHTFCESDIRKFRKKQKRRVKDFLYHKIVLKDRNFNWETSIEQSQDSSSNVFVLFYKALLNNFGIIKFVFSCITVFPLVIASIKGFLKKRDIAWFFHILACEITLWEYSTNTLISIVKKEEVSRDNWSQ